jgi:serine/threonine protein kinase
MFAPGTLLSNRYRLDCLLGEGGMGSVWRAEDERMRRTVAVKVLKAPAPDESAERAATERRRLLREARAASAVRHPSVVQVLDVVDEGELPFLVMELLEGCSLKEHLDRVGQLDVITACALMTQVASAVGAAHDRGIVHRDLKPENVFLMGAGEVSAATQVKVLDFGIAKVLHRPGSAATADLTREGHLLGSPPYMSPEQAFGEADIDHRTDLWSLGIVLYECLSGVLPTRGENTGQVFKIVTKRGVMPIEEIAPDVPADLAGLLRRLLAQEPADRPGSMREVIDVLARHAPGAARDVRRSLPGAVATQVPPALDSLQGLIVAETALEESRPPSPAPRRRTGALLAAAALLAIVGVVVVEVRPWHGDEAGASHGADTAPARGPEPHTGAAVPEAPGSNERAATSPPPPSPANEVSSPPAGTAQGPSAPSPPVGPAPRPTTTGLAAIAALPSSPPPARKPGESAGAPEREPGLGAGASDPGGSTQSPQAAAPTAIADSPSPPARPPADTAGKSPGEDDEFDSLKTKRPVTPEPKPLSCDALARRETSL